MLKYGLSSCSFSDRMSLVDHMQISIGNGNSPRLWLDAYCTPLVSVAPGFSWQCDLGRWRSLEPCFALCVKIIFHIQYATMWLPLLLVTTVKYDAQSKAWDILLVLTSVAGNLCNKCPSSYSNKTAVKVIFSMRSLVSIEQQSPRRLCDK